MRLLTETEVLAVAGGEMESNLSVNDMQQASLGGALAEVAKQFGWAYAWDSVKGLYGLIGQAGSNPPANETDNGGTSYGISTCNSFGCS